MSRRVNWLAGSVIAILLASLGGQAQQSPYGVEEWNSFQDTRPDVTQNPQQRMEHIQTFLRQYPDSVLRAYVYPNKARTAWVLQDYPTVIEAANQFLRMDRSKVVSFYRRGNENLTDAQIDQEYYSLLTLYAFSYLQILNNQPGKARALTEEARERARQGLELHESLYKQVSAPNDPEKRKQFEQQKEQAESAFRAMLRPHRFLANAAWQRKDYDTAVREYLQALEREPNDPIINYRLGVGHLRKEAAQKLTGFWYLARAIAFNVSNGGKVRDFLTKAMAAYQQVPPDCLGQQVANLIQRAPRSTSPPPDWELPDAEAVQAVRQTMSVKRIFEELQKGGEDARLMYLASCGTEIGVGDNGQPELAVMVLGVNQQGGQVILRAAAGQEAVDAKQPNLELVTDTSGATNLKAEDVVRVSGKITGYTRDPQFLLKLTNGKVHPEDLPNAAARRGG